MLETNIRSSTLIGILTSEAFEEIDEGVIV